MERNSRKEAALFIFMFFTYYGSNALFWEFIVVYLTDAGYTATFAGGLITITYLINLLVQPAVGVLSDKLGSPRKILMLFALLLAPGAYFLPYAVSIPWLLTAAMIYLSVFDNPMCSLLDSYAVKNQERLGITYGLIRASGSLGYAVALICGGGAMNRFGFNAAFHLRFGLLAAMALLLLMQGAGKSPGLRPEKGGGKNGRGEAGPPAVENPVDKVEKNYTFLPTLFNNRQYLFVLCVILVYQIAVRVFATFSPILIREFGGDNGTIGFIGGMGCFIQIPVMILAGKRASGTSSLKPYLAVFALLFCRCALIWAFPGIWAMFIGTVLQQAAGALSSVVSVEMIYRYSPKSMESTGITVGQAVTSSIAMLVGNLLGGIATDALSPMAIVALSGGFAGIGFVLAAAGDKKLTSQEETVG